MPDIKNIENTGYGPIHLKANQRIDQLPGYMFPAGSIIEKKYTGIGATQSEIKAPRHSIIVFPSKSIAYNKSLSNSGTFYVGSLPDSKKKITSSDIHTYYRNTKVKYKKYLVVANSLTKVFDALGESTIYRNFFIMFDEIDKFQGESTFRTELENCLDYYNPKVCKGCLLSATLGSFSNRILDSLVRINVELENHKKRQIALYRIDKLANKVKLLFHRIRQHPQDKFLIAHKSIKAILRIIDGLDYSTRRDAKVLCGEGSLKEVEPYYGTLLNDKLPGRINFMTAAYFSGVDIEEDFHLVIISDNSASFSLLTTSEIRQIVGRGRKKLLTVDLIIPKQQYDIKLLKLSDLIADAQRALLLAKPFQNGLRKLQLDEEAILNNNRAHAKLTSHNVLLLRVDRSDQLQISNFTIDQYWNSHKELRALYSTRRLPIKSLNQYFTVTIGVDEFSNIDFTQDYRKSFLNALVTDPNLTEECAISEDEKKIYARYKLCQLLIEHKDISWIIEKRYWRRTNFKKAYIEKYLGDISEHSQFLEAIRAHFQLGIFYTDEDVKRKVTAALQNYNNQIPPITGSDYVSVLNVFYYNTKTTSKHQNGFMINAEKHTHYRFSLVTYFIDIEEYLKYWNNY